MCLFDIEKKVTNLSFQTKTFGCTYKGRLSGLTLDVDAGFSLYDSETKVNEPYSGKRRLGPFRERTILDSSKTERADDNLIFDENSREVLEKSRKHRAKRRNHL